MSERYRVGEMVIVRDEDIGDEYLARVAQEIMPGTQATNPIVEVLRILRYPMQHSVLYPEIPDEHPPIRAGTLCRMPVARAPCGADLRHDSWEASLAEALADALGKTKSEEEQAILRRHADGCFRGRRAILTYKRWELWQP